MVPAMATLPGSAAYLRWAVPSQQYIEITESPIGHNLLRVELAFELLRFTMLVELMFNEYTI